MPEGPEVRRYADRLADALVGRRIEAFDTRLRRAQAWLDENPEVDFEGRKLERVWSHGKHLIGEVEGDLFFHAHLMMWGSWHVVPPDDPQVLERDRRERARVAVPDAVALLFSAPVFHVGHGNPYALLPRLASLGPDILPYDGDFDAEAFVRRLTAPGNQERTIGAALLDQRIAAGIGNYLRADILFLCRLDPWRRIGELTPDDLAALSETIPEVAQRAYETGGRTVTDDVQQRMEENPTLVYRPGSPWGTRHYVFRRTNLPCLACGDTVRQRRQVTHTTEEGEEKSRIIYFCPTCQQASDAEKAADMKKASRAHPPRPTRSSQPA